MRVDQAEWWAEFKIFEDRDGRYYWQLGRQRPDHRPVRLRLRKQVLV